MKFSNKNIWTLTDGSQGMISQVNGLAKNFSNKIHSIQTELIFPWSVLQPGILPIYKWIFKNKFDLYNEPEIIISCGRRSVYLSLYIKKILKKNIINIHIQNPKISYKKFDFIIAPNHDNISGKNVIQSTGAIHHFTKEDLTTLKHSFPIKTKNLISVIVGGRNSHYNFSKNEILDLIGKIKNLKRKYKNYNYLIICSRRTSEDLLRKLQENLNDFAFVWNKKGENPYLFALKYSSFFITTSDSTSMISECAFTGKPIYVYHLPFKRISKRIIKFHYEFEELKITQKFTSNTELKEWKYKILDEAKRISGVLKERIIKDK